MASQIINLSLPEDLVKKIDQAAKSQYGSRSEYIRQAVVGRLRSDENDRRFDEAAWDELIAGADELADLAQKAGLVTDEDFVRAVKEVRADKKR